MLQFVKAEPAIYFGKSNRKLQASRAVKPYHRKKAEEEKEEEERNERLNIESDQSAMMVVNLQLFCSETELR